VGLNFYATTFKVRCLIAQAHLAFRPRDDEKTAFGKAEVADATFKIENRVDSYTIPHCPKKCIELILNTEPSLVSVAVGFL